MKKTVKLISVLSLVFVISVGLFGNAFARSEHSKGTEIDEPIPELFGPQARFYSFLKDTADVYRIMQDTAVVYKEFLSGKLSGDFGGEALAKNADFKPCKIFAVSGSLGRREMSSHGPYKNYTGIRLLISGTGENFPISVLIFDNTAHRPIALKTAKKSKIEIYSHLDKTHSYTVFVFNKSGEKKISYFGKLMFSD